MGSHRNTLDCYKFPLCLLQVKHIFSNKLNLSVEYKKIYSQKGDIKNWE